MDLFGLGIMTVVKILKWEGQWSKSKHILAMSMNLLAHSLSLMIFLICLYPSLFGLDANKLLNFLMAENNSAIKKGSHSEISLLGISFNKLISTCWFWAKLKELWRAFHKLSSSIQKQLLYCIASIAGNLCLLTQFMSSQDPHFLLLIWSIFLSKKICLVVLTIPLNFFQSVRFLDCLYMLRSLQQFSFYGMLSNVGILRVLEP